MHQYFSLGIEENILRAITLSAIHCHAYNPSRDARWPTSLRIAERAITGEGMSIAPGALFFHTAGHSSQISRSRPRVARLGGMDFYR